MASTWTWTCSHTLALAYFAQPRKQAIADTALRMHDTRKHAKLNVLSNQCAHRRQQHQQTSGRQ
eukprot:4065640-Alexandrium_andersonii.AAC.1